MTIPPVFVTPPAPLHPGEHYQAEHAHQDLVLEAPQPVPVTLHYTKPVPISDRGADFGPWISYSLTATQTPFQLLPHDEHRRRAVIVAAGPAATAGNASATTTGSQTTPAAGTTITSQALAAGTYQVAWQVQLSGTLAAADANNFGLNNGATQVAQSLNSAVAGTYIQPVMLVVIPAGGATLAVKAIVLATTGAVYVAQLTTTLISPPPTGNIFLGSKAQVQASPTLGGSVPFGTLIVVQNKRDLWIAPDGSHTATVAMLVERFEQ